MPRIRIAAAGASIVLFLAVTLGSAAAQYEAAGPVGEPLPLLQFTQHKGKARLSPHPKLAAMKLATMAAKKKKVFRERIAKHLAAKPHRAIADARPVPAPAPAPVSAKVAAATPDNSGPTNSGPTNSWPTTSAATPDAIPTPSPDQSPPSVTTEQTVNADPDQIVTSSNSVQAALPDGLDHAAPPAAPAETQTNAAAAAPAPVVHALVVRAEPQDTGAQSPIDGASWLEHVLAALGGAITAGVVAWFLIKPAPERTYG